jgi:hypothetical protein
VENVGSKLGGAHDIDNTFVGIFVRLRFQWRLCDFLRRTRSRQQRIKAQDKIFYFGTRTIHVNLFFKMDNEDLTSSSLKNFFDELLCKYNLNHVNLRFIYCTCTKLGYIYVREYDASCV